MSTPLAAADTLRGAAPDTSGPAGVARASWREIIALLRLAVFMRVDGASIVGRESTIALLGFISLAAWIVVDPLIHSRGRVLLDAPRARLHLRGVFALAGS